jgi:diguanylate cyclase (GGDEF)-like protein
MQIGALMEAIYHVETRDKLFKEIVSIIPDFIYSDRVSVTVYDEQSQSIWAAAMHGVEDPDGKFALGKQVKIGKNYQQYHDTVCNASIWQPDDEQAGKSSKSTRTPLQQMKMLSVMNVPIWAHSRIIGTINVGSCTAGYTEYHLSKLDQITKLVGVAAERIAHNELQTAAGNRQRLYAEHLQLLNVLGEKLSLITSVDEAFERVSDCIKKLVNATRVSYCVLEPDRQNIKIIGLAGSTSDSAGQLVPLGQSGLADILIHGRTRYVTDLVNSDVASQRSLGRSGVDHLWSFPIVADNTILGALNIGSKSIALEVEDASSVLATLSRFLGSTLQRLEAQQQTLQMIAEIEHQARTDTLTGLPNRTEFYRRLDEKILEAADTDKQVGVLFLDLDLFKNINDTLGHAIGDVLLCRVSERFEEISEEHNLVARIGGDEFLIMCPQINSAVELGIFGQRLIQTIKQPLKVADKTLQIGVSIGAVSYPEHGRSRDELIKNADIAMYHAKASGRNQCRVFNDHLAASVGRRVHLESLLVDAIGKDQFSLVFQPQYDFESKRPVAVEALLRWNHPLEGFIPPDEFIGVAEQCGAIDRITDWVIEHSLSAVRGFRKFVPDLRVAVNVSANEFSSHNDLYNRVSQALARSGLPSDALELELTETALLSHPEHASDLIRKLSDAGIQIAIDDFGTGYASMSHLIQLPINTIKIDRSFVDGLECDARKQSVVKGILAIANGMDLYSVGEGVETAEQFDCLNKYGCLSAQGYLLSKPVPEDEVCNVLMSLDGQIEAA